MDASVAPFLSEEINFVLAINAAVAVLLSDNQHLVLAMDASASVDAYAYRETLRVSPIHRSFYSHNFCECAGKAIRDTVVPEIGVCKWYGYL